MVSDVLTLKMQAKNFVRAVFEEVQWKFIKPNLEKY